MPYSTGTATNIVTGAAVMFVGSSALTSTTPTAIPTIASNSKAIDAIDASANFKNVGFTQDGLELSFEPNYNEVMVDQVLDAAKIFKTEMKAYAQCTLAEATLANVLIVLGSQVADYSSTAVSSVDGVAGTGASVTYFDLNPGSLFDAPVERTILWVGNPAGKAAGDKKERIYAASRCMSMETVSISIKRDEASLLPVRFRLLADNNARYGRVYDRTYA
jgi:hypothetical protein